MLPGLLPVNAVDVDQQPHQFGDGDRRMRVVELDRDLVGELADVAVLLHVAADQILQRGGGEEIFLPQPQFLARRRRVARIEHLGDRLGAHLIGERADVIAAVEGVEPQRVGGARRPQAQRVDVLAAPADDRRVIGDGHDGFARAPDMRQRAVGEPRAFDMAAKADRRRRSPAARTPRDCRRTASPPGIRCCQPSLIVWRNRPWS